MKRKTFFSKIAIGGANFGNYYGIKGKQEKLRKKEVNSILNFAKENGCKQFYLDSGVQRFGAHRFYLKNRMIIAAHHFSFDL